MWGKIVAVVAGRDPVTWWLASFLVGGLIALVNLSTTFTVLSASTKFLEHEGVKLNHAPASPWTMVLISPCAAIMGLYVHSGFELFPRWWNRTWFTRWFITATFHDQHHRYFKGNYGGFTTIWDWICGTVRPTFLADYEKVTTRPVQPLNIAARTR
jgi:hypothetical protein